jgi:DNA-binding PadR family transcriptional regulator
MNDTSELGYALLGLLHQQPMSGYDLRKIFTTTAMGSFSDSPGAIYPALGRLEARGFAQGTVEETTSLRKRRVYEVTAKGLAIFEAWLKMPITRDDVIRRVGELMLRFAFVEQTLGAERAVSFLSELAGQIAGYIPSLEQYLESHASEMPLSGRLALECGIQEYELRLRWARTSVALYERRKRKQP